MKTSKLKLNKKNPRRCAPDKLEKLMHSIESFPAMMGNTDMRIRYKIRWAHTVLMIIRDEYKNDNHA